MTDKLREAAQQIYDIINEAMREYEVTTNRGSNRFEDNMFQHHIVAAIMNLPALRSALAESPETMLELIEARRKP